MAYAFHAPNVFTRVYGYGALCQVTIFVTCTSNQEVGLLPFCVVRSSRKLHVAKSYKSTFVPSTQQTLPHGSMRCEANHCVRFWVYARIQMTRLSYVAWRVCQGHTCQDITIMYDLVVRLSVLHHGFYDICTVTLCYLCRCVIYRSSNLCTKEGVSCLNAHCVPHPPRGGGVTSKYLLL